MAVSEAEIRAVRALVGRRMVNEHDLSAARHAFVGRECQPEQAGSRHDREQATEHVKAHGRILP
jgi:hypothetical protein